MSNFYLTRSEEASMFYELEHWADNMTADPQESLDEICQCCFHRVRSWEVFCSQCGTMSTTFSLFPPMATLDPRTQAVDGTAAVSELGSNSGLVSTPELDDAPTVEALGHDSSAGMIVPDNALLQEAMGLLEILATMSPIFGAQTIRPQVSENTRNSGLDAGEIDYELQAEIEDMIFSGEHGLEPEAVYGDALANSNIPLVPAAFEESYEASEALPVYQPSLSQVPQASVVDAHEVDSNDAADSSDDGSLFEEEDDAQAVPSPAAFIELALPTGSRQIIGDRHAPNTCTFGSDEKLITADVSRGNAENINPTRTLPSLEAPAPQFSEYEGGQEEWGDLDNHENLGYQLYDKPAFQPTGNFNPSLDNSHPALPVPVNIIHNHSEARATIGASAAPSISHEKEGSELGYSRGNTEFENQEQSDALPEGRVSSSKILNTSATSSHASAKGKGKARQDVSNDEGATPPSLEHFTFTFVADGPFATNKLNHHGPAPGPSNVVPGKRRKFTRRAPRFPKSVETLGTGQIKSCLYCSCNVQLSSGSAPDHLRQHINLTRSGKCPKAGCSHAEKDNVQRLADHIMVKHMGFMFPCVVPQCPSTVSRRDLIKHHRTYTCTYCVFCGSDQDYPGSVLIEHEKECKSATDEQRKDYLRELAKSDTRKKTRKENKALKEANSQKEEA